jgi:hypothetical protein
MSGPRLAPALAIGIVVMTLSAVSAGRQAQTTREPTKKGTGAWAVPRTPDGQPDLQGVWVSNSATPLERPKALENRTTLTDEEVAELKKRADRIFKDGGSSYAAGDQVFLAALENVERHISNATENSVEMIDREFDNRTSAISDPPGGRIPPLTPAAQQKRAAAAAAAQRIPEGPEDLRNDVRCITWGVPRLGGNYGTGPYSYYQVFQAPGYLVLYMEAIHDARIIPLDARPHLPEDVRQWNGDSRGRWEGNTLVVETTNFSSKSNFMGSTENLRVVERLTRVTQDRINYEITIDDPTTWSRPWTAMLPLRQKPEQIYEFACHEGNYSMEGALRGARADDKKAESAKTTAK